MTIQSFLAFVLVVVLTAPLAMAAPIQEPPSVWQAFAERLEAGAFVEVRLKDGSKVKGHYIQSTDDTFRLKPKTRIAVPIRDFPYLDIESIDRKHEGFWSPGMKILVGTGIAVGVGILVVVGAYARG